MAIIIALCLLFLLGFAALAVDLSHMYVARNELQNAADAGALAGSRVLYTNEGSAVNTAANQVAFDAASDNLSENVPVDINWTAGNDGDIQRGHWSFGLGTLEKGFYPNASTEPVDLWNATTVELDQNINFINAVKVTVRRQTTQVASFFATVFGHSGFEMAADGVGYIGFAGSIEPLAVDQPIAICAQSIRDPITGAYTCNIGRMLNSGVNPASQNSAGWTDFNQDNPCSGGTNANVLKTLIPDDCSGDLDGANPDAIIFGQDIATTGGVDQSVFQKLYNCWLTRTEQTRIWNLTLPVIDCPGNNVTICEEVRGAVNLNVVWIQEKTDPHCNDAPSIMYSADGLTLLWEAQKNADGTYVSGQTRWDSFVTFFNLQNVDGTPAPFDQKSIYFLPDCTPHEPTGLSGGENFGILAEIPVLVE